MINRFNFFLRITTYSDKIIYHHAPMTSYFYENLWKIKKNKSVLYSSQGSHTGQLDFCNWLADDSRTVNVISITFRQVY